MEAQTTPPSPPPRRVIASYTRYEEAQRAVDYLSDEKFPVERVAIIGEGLQLVEQVTGRLTWGKAALNGVLGGAITGLFLGWLLGLFNIIDPLVSSFVLALWGLAFGVVIGAIMGVIGYAATGGRRDFTSVGTMRAQQYNIMVDAEVADEAQRLLSHLSS
jgi:heat induced stress protein YflT